MILTGTFVSIYKIYNIQKRTIQYDLSVGLMRTEYEDNDFWKKFPFIQLNTFQLSTSKNYVCVGRQERLRLNTPDCFVILIVYDRNHGSFQKLFRILLDCHSNYFTPDLILKQHCIRLSFGWLEFQNGSLINFNVWMERKLTSIPCLSFLRI